MGQACPMCGRYAASREPAALVEEFDVEVPPTTDLPARYNIAPTNEVYVVRDGKSDETGHHPRRLDVARWGLVPSWAKDPSQTRWLASLNSSQSITRTTSARSGTLTPIRVSRLLR